jgi:FAD:protein FMN transferase
MFPKKIIASVVLFLALFNTSCNDKKEKTINLIRGEAQGTTYQISIYDYPFNTDPLKIEIDNILNEFDLSLSTYHQKSLITQFNKEQDTIKLDKYFFKVLQKSIEIAELSDGNFDVTIAPLVNAWGFGFDEKSLKMNQSNIDSLLQLVNYKNIYFDIDDSLLVKKDKRIMLDFNAIAQGYSVDVVKEYLEKNAFENFMIEIGGELVAKGYKSDNQKWRIGIDKPSDDGNPERSLKAIVSLENKALATSGNYRKFYIKDGLKYSHTINPKTGMPVNHNLLSATVITDSCADADAFATLFMVLGKDKSLAFIEKNKDLKLSVYFIFDNEQGNLETYISPELLNFIEEL